MADAIAPRGNLPIAMTRQCPQRSQPRGSHLHQPGMPPLRGAGIRNVVLQRRSRASTLLATDMPIEASMLRAALISDKA